VLSAALFLGLKPRRHPDRPHPSTHLLPTAAPPAPHLQMRVLGQDLGLPAQGGAAHHRAGGQLGEVPGHGGDEGVAHVLAGEVAGEDGALGEVGGDVLFRGRV